MPTPSVIFAFILATIYGALFHLLVGGDVRRLALYLLAAWLGFTLGHFAGALLGFDLLQVGALRVFSATAGAWVALLAAHLFLIRPSRVA